MKPFVVERGGGIKPVIIQEPGSQFPDLCASLLDGGVCGAAIQARLRGKDSQCAKVRAVQKGNGDGVCQPFGYEDAIGQRNDLTNKTKEQLRDAGLRVRG